MWQRLAAAVGAVLFCASIAIVVHELEQIGFVELTHAWRLMSGAGLPSALGFTALNYAVLTLQDQLAVTYAGVTIPRGQVTLASFIAYAVSNSVGFAMLSGTSARYRFYSRWGVDARALSRVVLFYSVSFWIGLGVVAGVSLVVAPPAAIVSFIPPPIGSAVGIGIVAVIAAYAALCVRG